MSFEGSNPEFLCQSMAYPHCDIMWTAQAEGSLQLQHGLSGRSVEGNVSKLIVAITRGGRRRLSSMLAQKMFHRGVSNLQIDSATEFVAWNHKQPPQKWTLNGWSM